MIKGEIQSIQKEFILETKVNMNAHVCDQKGCSIILDYGPTCGGFFHELRSILHVRKLQEIELNQDILRDKLQKAFYF